MKIKLSEIIAFQHTLTKNFGGNQPINLAYKLAKISSITSFEVEFYTNRKNEIIEKYAQKTDDGQYKFSDDGSQILIKDGLVTECHDELNELENQEVELEIEPYLLDISDFGTETVNLEQLLPIAKFMK